MVLIMEQAKVRDPKKVMDALKWLGIMDESRGVGNDTLIDGLCQLLESKLTFGPEERDMVLMHHEIIIEMEKGQKEGHSSSLMVFGDARDSAMAKTVGLTCGIATELLLEKELEGHHREDYHGIITPLAEAIYNPMLERLEDQGLVFNEIVQDLSPEKI